jgi:hypothetical protein
MQRDPGSPSRRTGWNDDDPEPRWEKPHGERSEMGLRRSLALRRRVVVAGLGLRSGRNQVVPSV